jgi:hypothetical protein
MNTKYKAPQYAVLYKTAITSSLSVPNILLSILLSNALNLRYSLNIIDQAAHFNKTRRKLYFGIFQYLHIFRQQMRKQKLLNWTVGSIS